MHWKKARDIVSVLMTVFVISLTLNYKWESIHEAFLYEVFICDAKLYILMILEAAVIEAAIILSMYLGVSVVWKDILWVFYMKKSQLYAVSAAGIIIAIIIEYRGTLVLREWSYLSAMPTLFGIGLSPLIQLSTTGLLTFWLTRRFMYQKCACE